MDDQTSRVYSYEYLIKLAPTDYGYAYRTNPDEGGQYIIKVPTGWVFDWMQPSMSSEEFKRFLKRFANIDENSLFSTDEELRRLVKDLYFSEE